MPLDDDPSAAPRGRVDARPAAASDLPCARPGPDVGRVLRVLGIAVCLLCAAHARPASAQAPPDLLTLGARAYQDLRFDLAAGLLRLALDPVVGASVAERDRSLALSYLAAVELYRGQPDSAASTLRRLVRFDPRYRPDPLVFPPEVTDLFDEVRRQVRIVSVSLPAEADMAVGDARLAARLHASSPHEVRVTVADDDGRLLRTLFAGRVRDSLVVHWDGRDSTGHSVAPGHVWLAVASHGSRSRVERLTRVPIELTLSGADTVPHPPPPPESAYLPERTGSGPVLRALAGGVALGTAVLALPRVLAGGDAPSGARFVVAGAIGLSTVIGSVAERPGRPVPDNAAANDALRAHWRERVADVVRENAERRRDARLHVRVGPAVVVEEPGA